MDSTNYNTQNKNPMLCFEPHRNIQRYGWGCFIIFDKKYWIDIPDNIKIWFGDDFVRILNKSQISYLTNFKIDTEMSTTSDEVRWNETKMLDGINFRKLLKN